MPAKNKKKNHNTSGNLSQNVQTGSQSSTAAKSISQPQDNDEEQFPPLGQSSLSQASRRTSCSTEVIINTH